MLKMAAILKSKMAAKREMTSNVLSTFITIHDITNIDHFDLNFGLRS